MATPKQLRRRGRLSLRFGTVFAALLFSTVAFAGDNVGADGDAVDATQADPVSVSLAPGASVTKTVGFILTCKTQQHVDAGEIVPLTFSATNSTAPSGGSVSGTNGSVGPRSAGWPADGAQCSEPPQTVSSTVLQRAQVTLTAPSTPGTYTYVAEWAIGATAVSGENSQPDISGSNVTVTYNVTVAVTDSDGDGLNDNVDNCPNVANADQANSDSDALGNACDPDDDNDTVADGSDNCQFVANLGQANNDGDALGDACDPDDDNDTVADGSDNCQFAANSDQENHDGDALGDACDPDDDNDTVADGSDNCQFVANPGQHDNDNDGRGLACDSNDYRPDTGTLPSDASGNEGGTLTASGSFTDGDGNGTLSISKSSGAGAVVDNHDGTWSWSLATTDNGSGTVVVEANDGEHAVVTESFNWSAANVAPSASITGAPANSPEGTQISLGSSVSDPSSADTAAGFTKSWSVTKNGTAYASGSGASFSFTPDDNGSYVVSFSATDKDGGTGSASATITVTNVAPSIQGFSTLGASGTACQGGNTVTVSFSVTDPADNSNDPITGSINWGDGSSTSISGRTVSESHTYAAGSYTLLASVSDGDGGTSSASSGTTTISHLYSMSGILAPFNADGTSVWKYGSTLPVKVRITDCNNEPVPGLAPRVGTTKVSSSDPTIAIDETASTSAADTTGVMRYDATAGIYIYNFASKNLADGSATYYMTVKGTNASGVIVTSPPMVQVKFGLKTK